MANYEVIDRFGFLDDDRPNYRANEQGERAQHSKKSREEEEHCVLEQPTVTRLGQIYMQ